MTPNEFKSTVDESVHLWFYGQVTVELGSDRQGGAAKAVPLFHSGTEAPQ